MTASTIPAKIDRSIAMLTKNTREHYQKPNSHLIITIDRSRHAYGSAYLRDTAEDAAALAAEFNRRRKSYQGHDSYCICIVAPDDTITTIYRYQPKH